MTCFGMLATLFTLKIGDHYPFPIQFVFNSVSIEYFPIYFLLLFQLDGGITTPPNELEDISEFGMFFSQVDGGDDEDEKIPGNFIF